MSSPLKSNNGQIAIFLVLLFQVLFVFFAMSMNIGLVVYDKINLQNSADISAYYAAQKQAELLNQIAHINYQMRQAYKLLTFRLRVIGSASIGLGQASLLPPHPIRVGPVFNEEANRFFPTGSVNHQPGVCVASSLWHEYTVLSPGAVTSLCRDMNAIVAVPPAGGGDPFGFTTGLNQFITRITTGIEEQCIVSGVINWQLAASWYLAYVTEVTRRKEMIDALASNMSLPGAQIEDFTGQSILNGARETLRKNLTEPQRQGLADFQLQNSLSTDIDGPCSNRSFWLPTIDIYPALSYVSMIWIPGVGGGTCSKTITPNRGNSPPANYLAQVPGRNNAQLQNVWNSGQSVPYGVEKNPWCMPYMSVKVTTRPRKIFSPFGSPPVLKAEAYAKPFGGRVGPWYSNQWSSGDTNSSGTQKIDPLLPGRNIAGNRVGSTNLQDDIVNHSKYPGDIHGMNSNYALGVMHTFFRTMVGNPLSPTMPPAFALAHYNHVGDPQLFDSQPDSLARPNGLPAPDGNRVRLLEEAAIIPDIFDVTYYSIEAQYSHNFYNATLGQFKSFVEPHYPDLGSQNRAAYSVVNQLTNSRQVFRPNNYPFYLIENAENVLTGWTQNKAVNYEFPEEHFAKCIQRRDEEMATNPGPGGCPHGGRSGYSVKIVSQDYLRKVNSELGGPGNTGAILNPPPSSAP